MSRTITVIAKGDFGYHPASGHHLRQGEQYTIEESAFSEQLFERATGGGQAAAAEPEKTNEGGED